MLQRRLRTSTSAQNVMIRREHIGPHGDRSETRCPPHHVHHSSTETTHQRIVLAWGQILFTELGGVWTQLDTEDTLAFEDKLAAQVHVLADATASLALLSDALGGTCRQLKQHL